MFKIRKKRELVFVNKFDETVQCQIKKRALKVIRENGYDFFSASVILEVNHPKINLMQAGIEDVIEFIEEYGVTLDYMFGRTDTPYYTM